MPRPRRGAAVPGGSARVGAARRCRAPARSSGSSGRSPAGPSPAWSASSATSTSPRRRSRRRSSSPSQRWPTAGLPPSPAGWIITTARNRAIDRLRREASRDDRHAQAALLQADDDERPEVGPVTDDRLRLIFTCCHPALATNVQIALTLRLIAGLQTAEIARAFLVPEPTMAQRLVRAKKKIKAANIPYRVPDRRRAARPAEAGARGRLPGLQRGLRRHHRRRARPRRAVRRGHPPRPPARRAAARRGRGPRPARPAAAHRGPPPGPHRARRLARAPRRPGPVALGPRR